MVPAIKGKEVAKPMKARFLVSLDIHKCWSGDALWRKPTTDDPREVIRRHLQRRDVRLGKQSVFKPQLDPSGTRMRG